MIDGMFQNETEGRYIKQMNMPLWMNMPQILRSSSWVPNYIHKKSYFLELSMAVHTHNLST